MKIMEEYFVLEAKKEIVEEPQEEIFFIGQNK